MQADPRAPELALFPLRSVLFPGGLLELKVFEVRYLDLMAACLRERRGFGVVALRSGGEVQNAKDGASGTDFETIGVLAELLEVDSEQAGILQVRCRSTQRFEVHSRRQQADGLWLACIGMLPDDEPVAPIAAFEETVRGLINAITQLQERGVRPFLEPYRFDDAGWVANRWCELLPITQAAKQKLMELPDPTLRLRLVDDYLRSKGVVD
jgi:Lon protease-like protein